MSTISINMKKAVIAIILVAVLAIAASAVADDQAGNTNAGITCKDVATSLGSCVSYLIGQQPKPADGCCAGVRKMREMAVTNEDKEAACECMKTAAQNIQNVKDEFVAALPGQCGTPLPFPISSSIDCTK